MKEIAILLVTFQFKHFICDYPLQNEYMLGKFKKDWSFFKPLLTHSLVHALATFLISASFLFRSPYGLSIAFILSLLDLFLHFVMDRIKAGPKYLGRFNNTQTKEFWWSLGLDQMFHHITHYLIIFILLAKK